MPEGAVYVGRPTRYGNPYHLVREADREEVISKFRTYATNRLKTEPQWLDPLRGKDLACWCALQDEDGERVTCHADVLLELANR